MTNTPFYLWSISDMLKALGAAWAWITHAPVLGVLSLALIAYLVIVAIITIGTDANQRA